MKKSGHGNFVETEDGWYMVHLCGRYLDNKNVCILGRETSLQKIEWIDNWPRMIQGNNTPLLEIPTPKNAIYKEPNKIYQTDFKNINLIKEGWLTPRTKFERKVKFNDDGIELIGGDSLTSLFNQSLIARRFDSFDFEAGCTLQFKPYHYNHTAGLTCYYNTKVFYYLYIGYDEAKKQRIIKY